MTDSRYSARGVSATKTEVHAAVDKLERGLFPGAFCKITPDHLTGDPALCNVIHSDGAGTKALLAYLHWRETGDATAFRGPAQDSLVMNIDDLLCVGATGRILISNTINRNARNIPGEVLAELIGGTEDFLAQLRAGGVEVNSGGGETADVGDLTQTLTVDSCATAVLRREDVITGEGITPGLAIVGLASSGRAVYEDFENSGIGSNGLTSARHDLLAPHYRETYPETWDGGMDAALAYCGPCRLTDTLPGTDGMTVGEALRSPTRTYAPVIAALLREHREKVRGLVHCSGGGQTKCLRFGKGVHVIKDNLFATPPVFTAIQQASGTSDAEMHQVYNMGHRMEIFCAPGDAGVLINRIRDFGIGAQVVGRTEASEQPGGRNHLSLTAHNGTALTYEQP